MFIASSLSKLWVSLLLLTMQAKSVLGQDEEVAISTEQLDAFHINIASEMEAANIRGAAYAFRGPGMDAPIVGTYGLTASSDDSAPVDIDTAFMLASVSKPFAGAAVATLIDQGYIGGLDDDICNVVGGDTLEDGSINTACRNPGFPDVNVTWRMMVTHRTSLIGDLPSAPDGVFVVYAPTDVNYASPVAGNPTCPLDDMVQFYEDLLVDKPTETTIGQADGYSINWYNLMEDENPDGGAWNTSLAPGEASVYSNLAVGYLAALVELATGETFEQYSQDQIFAKTGMNHTAWFRRDLPDGTLEAVPVYPYDEDTGTWTDVGHYCFADYASGQLHSTISDMVNYADVLLEYGIDTLWSNGTAFDYVFGCQEQDILGDFLDPLDCEWSLSWMHLNDDAKETFVNATSFLYGLNWTNGITHSGSEVGVSTEVSILPEAETYAIVLFNTEGADSTYFLEYIMEEGMMTLLEMDEMNETTTSIFTVTGPCRDCPVTANGTFELFADEYKNGEDGHSEKTPTTSMHYSSASSWTSMMTIPFMAAISFASGSALASFLILHVQ